MIQEGFVTIATFNLENLVNFYSQLLQESPKTYLQNRYAEFRILGLKLALFKPKLSHQDEFANPLGSGYSLCLEVTSIETVISSLHQTGYLVSDEIIEASHGREIYIYDPDGNRLILHTSK